MGYYTDYDFSGNSEEVIAAIEEISGYNESDDGCYYTVKWYDALDHMTSVSKQFPDQILTLQGEGEESDDLWKAYFKNGKSQYCKAIITFEPFDETKLK